MTNTEDTGPRSESGDTSGPEQPVQRPPSLRDNLSAAWQGQPVFRLMIILLPVLAVGALVFGLSGGDNTPSPESVAPPAARTEDVPGGEGLSPRMEQAIRSDDERRLQEAVPRGESFMPTPLGGGETGREGEQNAQDLQADPLDVFRAQLDQEQQQPQQPQTQQGPSPERAAGAMADGGLSSAMAGAMDSYLGVWTGKQLQVVQVSSDRATIGGRAGGNAGAARQPGPDASAREASARAAGDAIISAGEVHYAQMLTLADSSVPGPVLAEMLSGPFKGGRLIGTFSSTDDVLIIEFQAVVRDDKQYQIDAVALDPDTTLAGVATDVDRRYIERIILPAAASFVSGFGNAVAEVATTTTVPESGEFALEQTEDPDIGEAYAAGASSAADSLANVIRENAATARPIVRVAAGTALGILFTEAVQVPAGGTPPGQ